MKVKTVTGKEVIKDSDYYIVSILGIEKPMTGKELSVVLRNNPGKVAFRKFNIGA